jgi:hypothetical protein
MPVAPGNAAKDEQCLSFNISSNVYTPKSCEDSNRNLPSFCQVPLDGLMFSAVSNSTSKCTTEEKYYLFRENSTLFFAGLYGKLIIKSVDYTWVIFENNFELKEQKKIGTFPSYSDQLIDVIGLHQIECDNPKSNETDINYLKISNVSTMEAA